MMKNSRAWRPAALLFGLVFWVLFVLGGYYYYHKPITLETVTGPLPGMVDLAAALAITGLCGGVGRRLLPAGTLPGLERAAVQFSLGAGIAGMAWLGLGYLGLYHRLTGLLMLAAGSLLFWKDIRGWFQEYAAVRGAWQQSGTLEKWLAAGSALLAAYQLLIALAPPARWDSLAYHLQLPRLYLEAGRLVFIPENPYWGHPQQVEMLHTFAMSVYRAGTAAALTWTASMVALLGLFGMVNTQAARLARENTESPASSIPGWVAVTAVLAGFTFRDLMSSAYTDAFSVLFGLAAFITFLEWIQTRRESWFYFTMLFCGLAMGTKWTAGVLLVGLMLSAGIIARRSGVSIKKLLLQLWLPGALLALLVVLPWLIKNLAATGSPLYPYLFPTEWIDAARIDAAHAAPTTIVLWMHLLLPISTTWAGVDGAVGFSADLGPLLLLLALPGFIRYHRDAALQTAGLTLLAAVPALGIASLRDVFLMQTRLYFVLLPGLALAAGLGWAWLQGQALEGVRLRRILGAILLLVLALTTWQETRWQAEKNLPGSFLGAQTRQEYLEKTLGYYIRAMQSLEALPAGAKILMLWEPRGFYAPLNVRADLWIDRWQTDRRELKTAPAILQRWDDQGFTHLLIFTRGIELIRPQPGETPSQDFLILEELQGMLPEPERFGADYLIYRLPGR